MAPSSEKLGRWQIDVEPTRLEIVYATAFLAAWVVFGAFGYVAIEGWSLLDGFYMSFITVTTIGFGEVYPLSPPGKAFTMLIAFVGIGSVAFASYRGAQILLFNKRLRQRHLTRKMKKMRNHYILCGYGRIGRRMATDLRKREKSVVVIERNPELIQKVRDEGIPVLLGDASDEETLNSAGIAHARGLVTLLPIDSDNVFVTLVARELSPRLFILARTTHTHNRRKLLQAGASQVVAPSDVGADRMAQVILRPHVDRFMSQVMQADDWDLVMEEVTVQEGSFLAGKTLTVAHFRENFDVIVVAFIKHPTGQMQFNPGPNDRVNAHDILIVLGDHAMIERLVRNGCSTSAS